MGIFKKLKDVLFEIEEDELPVITKEDVKKESHKKIPKYQEENTIQEIKIPKEELDDKKELEKTFNFPLDVEENKISRRNKIDYKEKEDYLDIFNEQNFNKRVETKSRDLIRDNHEKDSRPSKVFKATPIISPVYGILDQNYSKDDVIVKTDIGIKGRDLDEIRKKAYGIENKKNKTDDKKVTPDEFDDSLKTLDEILMEEDKSTKEIKLPKKKDYIEETEAKISETKIVQNIDDNTETDLFNLIDSMYEDREGEEE